jgi:hypothetical protein
VKMEINATEPMELIKGIRQEPGGLFEMIRSEVKWNVAVYPTGLMKTQLTGFLRADRYERVEMDSNHRNGSYGRKFTLRGIKNLPTCRTCITTKKGD